MSAQVAAGADTLLAHTFLTHRRALARVGEARRARELTRAAVDLAREAAEQGRDRRDPDLPWARTPVLIAGVLSPLGEDPGSGRLGPVDAAIARDLHDHAGLLADAGVDFIVVEGPGSAAETAAGVRAARSMGIETWAVVDHDGLRSGPEVLGAPDGILVPPGDAAAGDGRSSGLPESWTGPHGVMIDVLSGDQAPALRKALAAGATMLGIADGATPERLANVRAAIDDHELARAAERDVAASSWLDWVALGAVLAPPGAAAWLAERSPSVRTAGREWTWAPPSDLRSMPAERYQLVVSEAVEPPLEELALRLQSGGVLVAKGDRYLPFPDALQVMDIREVDEQRWLIGRRR